MINPQGRFMHDVRPGGYLSPAVDGRVYSLILSKSVRLIPEQVRMTFNSIYRISIA